MADKLKKKCETRESGDSVLLCLGVVGSFTGHKESLNVLIRNDDENDMNHTLCFEEMISQNTTACLWETLGHHVRHHSHNINHQIKEYFFWRNGVLSLPQSSRDLRSHH